MGIITFASPVSGIRGKVGGNVYSANKSGPYIKAWGRGSNPRTETQTTHRASLVEWSQAWAGVSASNKADWDTYAALPAQDKTNSLGDTYSVSGFAWYVALSINLRAAGESNIETAPLLTAPAAPDIQGAELHVTSGIDTSWVRQTVGSPGLTDNLAVYSVIVNSDGVIASPAVRDFMVTKVADAGRRVRYQNELEARFGEIQLGQRMFAEASTQDAEGRQGPRAAISADAEA